MDGFAEHENVAHRSAHVDIGAVESDRVNASSSPHARQRYLGVGHMLLM